MRLYCSRELLLIGTYSLVERGRLRVSLTTGAAIPLIHGFVLVLSFAGEASRQRACPFLRPMSVESVECYRESDSLGVPAWKTIKTARSSSATCSPQDREGGRSAGRVRATRSRSPAHLPTVSG